MNTLGILKMVTETVVSIGAGAVVQNAIKISTPTNAKRITKISIGIGGFAISAMAGDKVGKYIVGEIDDIIAGVKAAKYAAETIIVEEHK